MDSPLLNFVAAVGVGLVIGLIGGFMLRSKAANAIWLAPVLAIVGALVATGAAYVFGEPTGYGWKEIAAPGRPRGRRGRHRRRYGRSSPDFGRVGRRAVASRSR